ATLAAQTDPARRPPKTRPSSCGQLLAQARMPADVCKAVAIARLIALRETDGGVGLYATRPFQSMLQARAGTDALAAHVRPAFATRRGAVLVSLDGRSAYDSMLQAAFLNKLREVAPEWIPFVRLFYGSPSTYCWWDCAGRCRDIPQGEGCERGDALAPVLFAFGAACIREAVRAISGLSLKELQSCT
ncbi:unnamed protein product, partial [Symbiodinium sp. KB8]